MSRAPTVSVVITCYNLGEFLDEAVESVQSQTFQDFDILIVDDGSTGETAALLASYARPKTRVLRIDNSGLPAARNAGIRNTTGAFLCMLDADDCLEPTYMERSVHALLEDPSLGFVSHWLRTFGDEVWEWKPLNCELPAFFAVNPINGAALFRREAWSAVGGFDETMREGLEDWDFWITLVERGWTGRILPEFLFRYRRRAASMSRVMMRGDNYARLYRALIDKHPVTYRQYLPVVLSEVEQESGALLAHIHDLEAEHYEWLAPELMSVRDDVAVLEAKVARFRARQQADSERARLTEDRDALATERARLTEDRDALAIDRDRLAEDVTSLAADRDRLADERDRVAGDRDRLAAELDTIRNNAREIAAGLARFRAEMDAMHRSWSWSVTWPLRLIYGWMLNLWNRGRGRRG